MTDHDDEHHPRESTRTRQPTRHHTAERSRASLLYRSARYDLGLTQEAAAERGHCGERSQRDRELGDCNLGALESLVAMAASMGQRLELRMVPLGHVQPANDNDAPPSLRPIGLAKCEAQKAKRARRRVS